jgi:protein involved in polysaccharide export with SLBB domain
MKLIVRGLFAGSVLMAGMVLTGCSSPSSDQLFSGNPKPAAAGRPTVAAPNGQDVARFRVGETVIVSFSGSPVGIAAHEEPIKEDGTINLDFIGKIVAVGKTAGELQNEIYTNYVPKYYVRLTVTVKSGDRVYYVGGEVNSHGSRQLYVGDTTVTKAIQSAGGLTDFANHGKVWLTHTSTGQRIRVDYDEALKNPAKDLPVYPDDQVYVDKRIW